MKTTIKGFLCALLIFTFSLGMDLNPPIGPQRPQPQPQDPGDGLGPALPLHCSNSEDWLKYWMRKL